MDSFNKRFIRRVEKWFTWREQPLKEDQLIFCATMALCFDNLDYVRRYLNTGHQYGPIATEFRNAHHKYLSRGLHKLKDSDL